MPLISKEQKNNRVHMQARIADQVAAELELYCRFLESRTDYVVENLLAFAFKKDREFQEWLATNRADRNTPGPVVASSANGAAADTTATTAARRRASTTDAA